MQTVAVAVPTTSALHAGTRDSQAQLLLGDSGWVKHKEGGVLYSLDVTKCMFSSGNTTERQRMGRLQCPGETVVDLYAGIGYYTLPFLCKAGILARLPALLHADVQPAVSVYLGDLG